ncbi:MAG: PilZ domain-containing protein [Thermodesulfovibrionales bacterium]
MNEQRRHKRFIVEGMEINGEMLFATEVFVLDVSISGMSFKADRRLDIDKEYTIRLQDHDRTIKVKGVVVWSSLVGNKEGRRGDSIPVYAAGMKFTNAQNDRISEIISFIESHERQSHEQGAGRHLRDLRFTIINPGSAVLQFPSQYQVKEISAGGMLIESDQALAPEERFPMELLIPEEELISFTGRVASCIDISAKGVEHFNIGIEFIGMAAQHLKKLHDFIAMLNTINKNV